MGLEAERASLEEQVENDAAKEDGPEKVPQQTADRPTVTIPCFVLCCVNNFTQVCVCVCLNGWFFLVVLSVEVIELKIMF